MTPRSFIILAGVTALAMTLAVATSLTQAGSSVIAERGKLLFPGLLEHANRITLVRVESPDKSENVTIRRAGYTFLDASGYPVRTEAIRELVASIANMVIEERKTDDPKRLAELSLADPDAKDGGGRRITLAEADGKAVVSLVAGDRDYSVGGAIGGQYVRRADETQAWLVRGAVRLPGRRADWFDNVLVQVDPKRIAAISITNDKGTVVLRREKSGLEIADLPKDKTADSTKIEHVLHAYQRIALYDVRKAVASADAKVSATVVVTLDDGTRITLRRLVGGDDKNPWFRLRVTPPEGGKVAKEATTLAERADHFEFKLEYQPRNVAGWGLDDLTVKPAQG